MYFIKLNGDATTSVSAKPQTRFSNSVLHPSQKQSIKLLILILHNRHQKTVLVMAILTAVMAGLLLCTSAVCVQFVYHK